MFIEAITGVANTMSGFAKLAYAQDRADKLIDMTNKQLDVALHKSETTRLKSENDLKITKMNTEASNNLIKFDQSRRNLINRQWGTHINVQIPTEPIPQAESTRTSEGIPIYGVGDPYNPIDYQ